MTIDIESITVSGDGARIININNSDIDSLAKTFIKIASDKGFLLVENINLDKVSFTQLVNCSGETAAHKFGTGSAELLELNADSDPNKIVTGRASLPLHTDGTFVDTHPSFIILYCSAFDQNPGDGATQICMQKALLNELPEHLTNLFKYNWEYNVSDKSHFPSINDEWISKPSTITKEDGSLSLNIALPFDNSIHNPGWKVRIPELEDEGASLFRMLDNHIKSSSFYYEHQWKVGNLLVINNAKVLHGRSTISTTGTRNLYRGQLQ